MALYCGIDLHSNNHVVSVIDESDSKVIEQKLNNDIGHTLNLWGRIYRVRLNSNIII